MAVTAVPGASAARGPCLVGVTTGPTCEVWEAKIAVVDDGDTVQARVRHGNKLAKRQSVRINGLQAMELQSYSRKKGRRGDCHSVEAAERLEQLVNKKRVRLMAQKASSSTTGAGGRVRLRRSIAVKRGGKWIDVGSVMLAEGHALWFPNGTEWATNGEYSRIAQDAAARGRGIWNPTACGAGSSHTMTTPLTIKVQWNAEDDDARNINGEWVQISNPGPTAVPLGGWWLRDSHFRGPQHGPTKGHGFIFPANTVVPAGGSIKLHVGRGSNSASSFYWGLDEAIFENATEDEKKAGDGAYVFDERGNLRAYAMYPCRAGLCTDAYAGKLSVTARYQGVENEWVTIKNISPAPISLYQYELESSPWFYEFAREDVLDPGKAIVVWIDEPHPVPVTNGSRLRVPAVAGAPPFEDAMLGGFRSWGHKEALLADHRDVVTLRNPLGTPVACHAWGGERCPTV